MPTATHTPLIDRIERVIDNFVNNKTMFTLLDVSQAVKQDGGTWISHSDMKPKIEEVLRDRFSSRVALAYYTESAITVETPAGPAQARLFHPVSEDPNTYTKRKQKALSPQAVVQVNTVQISSGHPSVTGRAVKGGRQQHAQGYVEVPRAIWKKAGFTAGMDVVIDIHPGSITVYRVSSKSKYHKKVLKMIADGCVRAVVPSHERYRLSPANLEAANLDGKTLDFSAYTDKFVVYPQK